MPIELPDPASPGGSTRAAADSKRKVYSPRQVFLGTFLCGPLAGLWYVKCNYDALGRQDLSGQAIHWGSALTALITVLMPLVPPTFPVFLMPLAYAFLAGFIAEVHQVNTTALAGSDRFAAHSNWTAAGNGAIAFAIVLVIAVGYIYCLDRLGLIAYTA
jgi:hypothetical protein